MFAGAPYAITHKTHRRITNASHERSNITVGRGEKMAQRVFTRIEKKFVLSPQQYGELSQFLLEYMTPDRFGQHTICSLYYDSPDDQMISNSVQKPEYKEKLRLRSYGVPQDDTPVFAEIKKKYSGVVNKRRMKLNYAQALDFFAGRYTPPEQSQIQHELEWAIRYYKPIPKCMVAYDRIALVCPECPDLRITFDENVRCRDSQLDLRLGDHGERLLETGWCIMEVKAAGAIPLWLVRKLSEMKVYKTSFSKYGTYFLRKFQHTEE